MDYPYEFRARVWNDEERKEEIARGIVRGANYSEAAARIDNYYRDELIGFTIFALEEDEGVMDFSIMDGMGLFNYTVTDTQEKN